MPTRCPQIHLAFMPFTQRGIRQCRIHIGRHDGIDLKIKYYLNQ
jgi:hypothetical protein